MRNRQLVLMLTLGIVSNYSFAQKRDIYKSADKYSDSLVLSYLISYFPDDSISKKEITRNGKTWNIRRYYDYVSFALPIENKSKCIKIVNFGAFIEHSPSFMLIMRMSGYFAVEHFVLGQESLEKDLITIQKMFSSLSNEVQEKYKLEVMDIFLQSKRGITQTSCYLH
jgi:hypothetical protein